MPPKRRATPAKDASKGAKRTPTPQAPPAPADVYELDVTLLDTEPPVWRRVLVQGDLSLGRLHAVIQVAMGWQGVHLHMFQVGNGNYSDPRFELEDAGGSAVENEFLTRVDEAFRMGKGRIAYEYDFGDCWEHEVRLRKAYPPSEAPQLGPVCIDGARACPPEDVGGIAGFERFLMVMADPDHPEYEETAEWCGGTFDAEALDLGPINRRLKRLR